MRSDCDVDSYWESVDEGCASKPLIMAKLIEPDGTENDEVSVAVAVRLCRERPGWSWEQIEVWL
jgi:hypothetical protein